MCSLRSSVALVVIGITFLNNKYAVLNSCLYKLILSIVLIKCRLCRANYSYKISVKVVLIRSIAVRNKLIQSVVNILSSSTIFGFQDAVAYVVISALWLDFINSDRFTVTIVKNIYAFT